MFSLFAIIIYLLQIVHSHILTHNLFCVKLTNKRDSCCSEVSLFTPFLRVEAVEAKNLTFKYKKYICRSLLFYLHCLHWTYEYQLLHIVQKNFYSKTSVYHQHHTDEEQNHANKDTKNKIIHRHFSSNPPNMLLPTLF